MNLTEMAVSQLINENECAAEIENKLDCHALSQYGYQARRYSNFLLRLNKRTKTKIINSIVPLYHSTVTTLVHQ